MRDALIGSAQSFQKSLEGIYGAGSFAPGGINTSQTSRVAPQEMKKQAFIQFRMSKGDSLEEATQKANAAMGGYGKKKGFVNAVGSGQFNDLSVGKDGKIKAAEKYTPGGVQASSESEMLRQFYNDLNAQALGAASGLPLAYRSDENRALGVRNPLTGAALNQVMNLNQVGLTPREQQNIDAIEKYYTDKLGTVIDKSTNDFIGSVENSGFQSSSLAKDMYMDIAGKPQAEYASDIAAKLAAQYSDMLNAAVNRQQAGLTGSLNAFNTIGRLSGADAITAAGGSPGEYGLFTDPQSAALAAEIQQANIGNRTKSQSFVQDALGRPINVMPEAQDSFLGRAVQAGAATIPAFLGNFGNKAVSATVKR
jgi:hypothetical protein